jgi:hypothetical protein
VDLAAARALMRQDVRRLVAFALWAVIALIACGPAAAATTPPPLPNAMAAIGDSHSVALNVDVGLYGSNPSHSWATGGDDKDIVRSHYERLVAANPSIAGNNHNFAQPRRRMGAMPLQAQKVVDAGAEYVTVLAGTNDLCTPTVPTMTPTQTFRSQFKQTLEVLSGGRRQTSVFVSSLPNVYAVWSLMHARPYPLNPSITNEDYWHQVGTCQSMLSPSNTEADRQAVLAQEQSYNRVLRQVCGAYANCRYDGDAIFNAPLETSDLTRVDSFHFSFSGQAKLASNTWTRSFWPALP